MRALVRLRQWWTENETGIEWQVRQVHRKDGLVELERPGDGRRFVPFGELGDHYELERVDA